MESSKDRRTESLAKSNLEELRASLDALSKGQTRPVISKLDNAVKKLSQAQEDCKSNKEKRTNNHIKTSVNILGALLNQIEAGKKKQGKQKKNKDSSPSKGDKGLPKDVEDTITGIAETAIDQLMTAKEAPLN